MTIYENLWDIAVLEKEKGYSVYAMKIQDSQSCPLKNKKYQIHYFYENAK